jgi:predicted transposase YdaD
LLRYNALLGSRHEIPVQSVVVLLRPKADRSRMSGVLHQHTPDSRRYIDFRYLVVRTWEQPVDAVLEGGLGTLPLAPISAVTEATLPTVVRRMDERIQEEVSPNEAATLWASTYILMGLRYPPGMAEQLLRGVRGMRESSTYQAILVEGRAEGRIEEARAILLRQGRKRFGPPDERVLTALEAIGRRERLEELSERLLDVATWEELLAET